MKSKQMTRGDRLAEALAPASCSAPLLGMRVHRKSHGGSTVRNLSEKSPSVPEDNVQLKKDIEVTEHLQVSETCSFRGCRL